MKTYTRKHSVNLFIDNAKDLCRLCLGKPNEAVPIFCKDSNNYTSLLLKIMVCVGFVVTNEESLPSNICIECLKEINQYYKFRKRCEATYQKLKSHLCAFKEIAKSNPSNSTKIALVENCNEMYNLIQEETLSQGEIQNADDNQHIVLKFNENRQVEIVPDVVNGVLHIDGTKNFVEVPVVETKMKNIPLVNEQIAKKPEPKKQVEQNIDLSDYLSTILLELGILRQDGNTLALADENMRILQLELNDGSQVVMELAEEDIVAENETHKLKEEKNTTNRKNNNTQSQLTEIKDNKIYERKECSSVDRKSTQCETCGKQFSTRTVLVRHMLVHSGERPFECALCGCRFSQREVLRRHELVHRKVRPFKCPHCPKSFTQRGAQVSHIRSHVPPQARGHTLHPCTQCGKVFLYASGLSRHIAAHANRMYLCGTCSRQFRDKSSLLRHSRTVCRTDHARNHPPSAANTQAQSEKN